MLSSATSAAEAQGCCQSLLEPGRLGHNQRADNVAGVGWVSKGGSRSSTWCDLGCRCDWGGSPSQTCLRTGRSWAGAESRGLVLDWRDTAPSEAAMMTQHDSRGPADPMAPGTPSADTPLLQKPKTLR